MSTANNTDDILFPADPAVRSLAREIYQHAKDLPLLSPHGHVDPAILAEDTEFPDPARLIISPDHYLTRMLLSQGIPPGELGVRRVDGAAGTDVSKLVGSRHPHNRLAATERARAIGADVVTTEMVAFEWLHVAGTPEFKAVSKLIK